MVQKNITEENVLSYQTRWEILIGLYDGKKRTAYNINKELVSDSSIASVIEHLRILKTFDLIDIDDASTPNMKRRLYWITEKGKRALHDYHRGLTEKWKENPEIFDEVKKFLGSK